MKCKCVKYFANIILYIMFKFQILKSYFKKFITINYYYNKLNYYLILFNLQKNRMKILYFRDLLKMSFKKLEYQNIIFVKDNQILSSRIFHLFLIMPKNITVYFQ